MEFLLRLLLIIVKFVTFILNALHCSLRKLRSQQQHVCQPECVPAISNRLLTLSVQELRTQLQSRQLTAHELVSVYIERINQVNSHLNAVVEDRFVAALREAVVVDELIAATGNVEQLFVEKPLLGLPVTVKESCALDGMRFAVGSLKRSDMRADADGVVVGRIRAAGGIPLLVSATPEFCYSIDTDTLLNGRCRNPYDPERTPGGSSGGEGALNGAAASLFGIGSDIGGSIRIPSLFCGVFGHKPTGGVLTVSGHFPHCDDADFGEYLVLGPITRFANDLAQLLHLMAGEKASQLRLHEPLPQLCQLKVHYAFGFEGLNGRMHLAVDKDIKETICQAVSHLKSMGLPVQHAQLPVGISNSLEIALSGIARLQQMPYAFAPTTGKVVWLQTIVQILRSLFGHSKYTTNALIFDLMRRTNAFMPVHRLEFYRNEAKTLAAGLTEMLGEDGVLLFPTMHASAPFHRWSPLHMWGVDYTLLFNVLGLPATHVPMGINSQGLPIGFSVIAAPFQDRLCLRMAVELERAFGGWRPLCGLKLIN